MGSSDVEIGILLSELRPLVYMYFLMVIVVGDGHGEFHVCIAPFSCDKLVRSGTNTGLCSVRWSCKIHRTASLQKVKTPHLNKCPGYDTKQSDGEVPVMLEFWWMGSTHLLPSLPSPLWPGVVTSNRVLSMGQIELKCVLTCKRRIVWNRTWLNCLK